MARKRLTEEENGEIEGTERIINMTFGDLKIGDRFAARISPAEEMCHLYEKKSNSSAYDLRERSFSDGTLEKYTLWKTPHLNSTHFKSNTIVHKLEKGRFSKG
jgi:hypothetical protein